ncbi:MAG: TetR/AcrR family transcriptional regulator [Caulobacteraceae bacterium]|nr:TetR/AcrR family transcriptional regulator [Caulobacteraceae bacterium]
MLEAAGRLFAAKGYEGVSMRALAQEAGCALGALYTLFPSKRALLRDIWEGAFEDLLAVVRERFAQADPAVVRLRDMILALIGFWLENPDHFRAIFLIEDQVTSAEERYFVESSQAVPAILALFLEAVTLAQAQGDLAPGRPQGVFEVLFAGAHGVASLLVSIPEFPWDDPRGLPARTVDALLTGLGPV